MEDWIGNYACVEVDAPSGAGSVAIPGSITKPLEGNGIAGVQADWAPASFDLSAFAGKTVDLRLRYVTDGAVAGNDDGVINRFFVDDVEVAGAFTDGAEAGNNGWK